MLDACIGIHLGLKLPFFPSLSFILDHQELSVIISLLYFLLDDLVDLDDGFPLSMHRKLESVNLTYGSGLANFTM